MYIISCLVNLIVVWGLHATYEQNERRVQAAVNNRDGPVVYGYWGLAQPIVDATKLLMQVIINTESVWRTWATGGLICTIWLPMLLIVLQAWSYCSCFIALSDTQCIIVTIGSCLLLIDLTLITSISCYSEISAARVTAQSTIHELTLTLQLIAIASTSGWDIRQTTQAAAGDGRQYKGDQYVPFIVNLYIQGESMPFDTVDCEQELCNGNTCDIMGILWLSKYLGAGSMQTNVILMMGMYQLTSGGLASTNLIVSCHTQIYFIFIIKWGTKRYQEGTMLYIGLYVNQWMSLTISMGILLQTTNPTRSSFIIIPT